MVAREEAGGTKDETDGTLVDATAAASMAVKLA